MENIKNFSGIELLIQKGKRKRDGKTEKGFSVDISGGNHWLDHRFLSTLRDVVYVCRKEFPNATYYLAVDTDTEQTRGWYFSFWNLYKEEDTSALPSGE